MKFSPFIIIQYHWTIFSKIGLRIWKLCWVQNEWRLDINLETVFIAVFIHHWMKVKYCLEFRWSKMLQIQRHVKASGINSKGEQWSLLLILLWKLKHTVRSFLEMGGSNSFVKQCTQIRPRVYRYTRICPNQYNYNNYFYVM